MRMIVYENADHRTAVVFTEDDEPASDYAPSTGGWKPVAEDSDVDIGATEDWVELGDFYERR